MENNHSNTTNQAEGLKKYQHSKVVLVKIYANHPQMHNLTTQHSIFLNSRDVQVSQTIWNMAYKLMAYHVDMKVATRPAEHGISYHADDLTVFADIAQLTAMDEYINPKG